MGAGLFMGLGVGCPHLLMAMVVVAMFVIVVPLSLSLGPTVSFLLLWVIFTVPAVLILVLVHPAIPPIPGAVAHGGGGGGGFP